MNSFLLKTKKRNTGIVLSSIGGAALVGGIAMIATADWEYTRSGNNYNSNDPKAVIGILSVLAGIPMTIIGIVKTAKGSKWRNHHDKYE